MDLNILWFFLIAVLYAGFFFLEGFDFGVGILLPFIGKTDTERRTVIQSIGPHWDGNEVWLITAAGATFAAFPLWYAAFFSGLYLLFFALLLALIVRGVAFEFRGRLTSPAWRGVWDGALFAGSLLPPVLLGMAFANLAAGVPLDDSGHLSGDPLFFVNGIGFAGGLALLSLFLLHGANFLALKLEGAMQIRAKHAARRLWVPALILISFQQAFLIAASHSLVAPAILAALTLAALLSAGIALLRTKDGWAFSFTGASVILSVGSHFASFFPNVLISNLNPGYSLTIYTAASSAYTLTVMTIIAVVFLPLVLLYQLWTYRVFRNRVKADPETLVY